MQADSRQRTTKPLALIKPEARRGMKWLIKMGVGFKGAVIESAVRFRDKLPHLVEAPAQDHPINNLWAAEGSKAWAGSSPLEAGCGALQENHKS